MIKCIFKDGKSCENYEDGFCIDRPCEYQEKSPQNLPKADAYSLLADVRALPRYGPDYNNATGKNEYMPEIKDGEYLKFEDIEKILSEHLS